MVKKILLPDLVELDIGDLGIYRLPGDPDTKIVYELYELTENIAEDEDAADKVQEKLFNLMEGLNEKDKIENLKNRLGFLGTVKITNAYISEITETITDTADDIKNMKKPQEVAKKNQEG